MVTLLESRIVSLHKNFVPLIASDKDRCDSTVVTKMPEVWDVLFVVNSNVWSSAQVSVYIVFFPFVRDYESADIVVDKSVLGRRDVII